MTSRKMPRATGRKALAVKRRTTPAAATLAASVALAVGLPVAAAVSAAPAAAVTTTYTVTSADDSGEGTLRAAIDEANAAGTADIVLDPGLDGRTIALTNMLPVLTGTITVTGDGTETIDAAAVPGEVFIVDDNASVAITGLTITGDSGPDSVAIDSSGQLSVSDSTIRSFGAAIYSRSGAEGVSITGSTVRAGTDINADNGSITVDHSTLTGSGYGVILSRADASSKVTVTDSTVAAAPGADASRGVLIQGVGNATVGTVEISHSTISGWQKDGIDINNASAATIEESTISGADVAVGSYARSVAIDNSTISDGDSQGLFVVGASVTVTNSILTGGADGDVYPFRGGQVAFHSSFVGSVDPSVSGLRLDSHSISGTLKSPRDAKLGALADNGGPTKTMLPKAGSPVIDAGTTTTDTTDQRGLPRAVGQVDMGSVEVQSGGGDAGGSRGGGTTAPGTVTKPAPATVGHNAHVTVAGAKPGTAVTIVNGRGKVVGTAKVSDDGSARLTLPTARLKPGTYAFTIAYIGQDGGENTATVAVKVKPKRHKQG